MNAPFKPYPPPARKCAPDLPVKAFVSDSDASDRIEYAAFIVAGEIGGMISLGKFNSRIAAVRAIIDAAAD